jgi:PAS domain S-box-containing protein
MTVVQSVGTRMVAALVAFGIILIGVGLTWRYFDSAYVLVAADASAAISISSALLETLLMLGVVAATLFALVVYVLLSVRVSATHLAHNMVGDLSWSREQFRRFYELSPVPYIIVTSTGIIDRPNKASLRFFGLTEEQLRGENLFAFLVPPEKENRIPFIQEQVKRRMPVEQVEVQARRKNGEVRWTLISVGDISVPGTKAHNGLVTLVDIHEQKELERIKTEFLSLASHQLRAPLANLKWYIGFLLQRRSEQLTDEVRKYLHQMLARNEDMIELVNTLLNMSRVEMGKVKVEKAQTDLTILANSIIEEVTPAAAAKKIHIVPAYPDSIPLVTDTKLVRIVVQNLLTNAIRYTPENGTVDVQMALENKKAVILVTDTGVGIPPSEQDKIFTKMYRATNAQQMEASGTGLGLYMSKSLIEAMGGTIGFTTKEGKGTTFTVTLPTT